MIGNSVSWALYFLWYGNLKEMLVSLRGENAQLSSSDYFIASGVSGILTAACTNPIWVIKTRMLSTARNAPDAYTGIMHGARDIWTREGIPGFYRGLIPSLFGVSHGAIQFMAYEQLKNHWAKSRGSKQDLTNLDYVNLSAMSKAFAGSVTYPYQVLRTRLQIKDEATGTFLNVRGVASQIWKQEGLAGFYRGLGPNIIRVLPSTCVTFLVYENTKHYLPRIYDPEDSAGE
ncbi:mitochondrial carrier [Viridothelium virens]|uniref:Mitochondrial carrier n=1 Tax=Viridothelium virens TaxID=1048519 RepID=A0A6A6HKV8_VIRVR|nr:mitochondrial carrier [Viridothelium virens]